MSTEHGHRRIAQRTVFRPRDGTSSGSRISQVLGIITRMPLCVRCLWCGVIVGLDRSDHTVFKTSNSRSINFRNPSPDEKTLPITSGSRWNPRGSDPSSVAT